MAITLNQNEIYAALSNMIISQEVFGDPLGGLSSSLVDRARVDGGLYGDTKLYVSTDALRSYPWALYKVISGNLEMLWNAFGI